MLITVAIGNPLTASGDTSPQYLKQPAGLHGPQEDLKGILSSSSHQLPTDIYSQGGELCRPRRRQRPEVSVPVIHKDADFLQRRNTSLLAAPPLPTTHLCRSNARTVPSRDALTMTKPLEAKVTLVTLLVCSVKVTKQRPLVAFHTLT